MEELGEVAALNFKDGTYTDANGQQRPMIEFSEDVLMPDIERIVAAEFAENTERKDATSFDWQISRQDRRVCWRVGPHG